MKICSNRTDTRNFETIIKQESETTSKVHYFVLALGLISILGGGFLICYNGLTPIHFAVGGAIFAGAGLILTILGSFMVDRAPHVKVRKATIATETPKRVVANPPKSPVRSAGAPVASAPPATPQRRSLTSPPPSTPAPQTSPPPLAPPLIVPSTPTASNPTETASPAVLPLTMTPVLPPAPPPTPATAPLNPVVAMTSSVSSLSVSGVLIAHVTPSAGASAAPGGPPSSQPATPSAAASAPFSPLGSASPGASTSVGIDKLLGEIREGKTGIDSHFRQLVNHPEKAATLFEATSSQVPMATVLLGRFKDRDSRIKFLKALPVEFLERLRAANVSSEHYPEIYLGRLSHVKSDERVRHLKLLHANKGFLERLIDITATIPEFQLYLKDMFKALPKGMESLADYVLFVIDKAAIARLDSDVQRILKQPQVLAQALIEEASNNRTSVGKKILEYLNETARSIFLAEFALKDGKVHAEMIKK